MPGFFVSGVGNASNDNYGNNQTTLRVAIMPGSSCSSMWQWNIRSPASRCTVAMRTVSPGITLTVSRHARYGRNAAPLPPDHLKLRAVEKERMIHVGAVLDRPDLHFTAPARQRDARWVETRAVDLELDAGRQRRHRRAGTVHGRHVHCFGENDGFTRRFVRCVVSG